MIRSLCFFSAQKKKKITTIVWKTWGQMKLGENDAYLVMIAITPQLWINILLL